jgi:DNA-directed RNA polymerase subunit E'/Rpb7
LAGDYRDAILARVRSKVEGKCSHHGYIKMGSISLFKVSMGEINAHTLNGDVQYTVQYYASVCNPPMESKIQARVVNMNRFGILAEAGYMDEGSGLLIPVLEIIVAKETVENKQLLDEVESQSTILVQVIGKKYSLQDTKISIVGKLESVSAERDDLVGGGAIVGLDKIQTAEDDDDIIDEQEEPEDDEIEAIEDPENGEGEEDELEQDDSTSEYDVSIKPLKVLPTVVSESENELSDDEDDDDLADDFDDLSAGDDGSTESEFDE